MNKEMSKQDMNIAFAQSVLMFAVMDIRKNGVSQEDDYMTPMLTAIQTLQDGYSEEDLCQMMDALAKVANGMFGKAGVEA
jgi:hypothetical protein